MVLPNFFYTVMSGDNYLVAVDFIITGDKESQTVALCVKQLPRHLLCRGKEGRKERLHGLSVV